MLVDGQYEAVLSMGILRGAAAQPE